jgi:hypothetical protein
VTNSGEKQFKGRKTYFGSQFQSCELCWIHSFGAEVREHDGGGSMWWRKMLISKHQGGRKKGSRRGPGEIWSPQEHVLNDLLLLTVSTTYQ